MKKFWYLIPALVFGLIACGGGDSATEGSEEATEETAATGASTDLSEYGFDYTITLPEGGGSALDIMENDWGGVDIIKGETFMLSIAFGEGDLELLKGDLSSDLMYTAEILDESPDHIMYKREIPDSGMDPEYHFIYVHRGGDDVIEIQNSKNANFNEEMINKMLSSAKSFAPKAGA